MGIYYINRLIERGPHGRAVEPSIMARRCGRCRRPTTPDARRWRPGPEANVEAGYAMGEWDLPLIWAGIIGIAVALYVILDGFDLGVGILFPYARDEEERDQMIGSIAPFWTATRPGWCSAAADCGSRSREPTRRSCQRCTCL